MIDKIFVNTQSSICVAVYQVIYFDPFKLEEPPHNADIVFITHAHPDHFSPKDIDKVSRAGTLLVSPESMKDKVLKAGFKEESLVTFTPGQKGTVRGIPVEAVPSYNIGKPMHPKENGWLGYLITVEDTRIYVCGDMDDIPEGRAVQCDIALIPIGGTFTMNAKAAASLVNEMRPKIAVPTHYGDMVGSPKDAQIFADLVEEPIKVCTKL